MENALQIAGWSLEFPYLDTNLNSSAGTRDVLGRKRKESLGEHARHPETLIGASKAGVLHSPLSHAPWWPGGSYALAGPW